MKLFNFLEKSEKKYILYAGLFAFLYFFLIIPWSIKFFDYKNPYLQFLLFTVGLMIILQVALKSIATNSKPKPRTILGLLFLFLALGILSTPYSVLPNGNLATPSDTSSQLLMSSVDYIVGLTWTNLGIHGGFTVPSFVPLVANNFIGFVFLCTYAISPMILFLIASLFLKNSTSVV
jgi:hypothetical protein